ncbi:hypothetical protein VM1G_02198 [Cytospora mali]|uniref:Uncharacterized protein n=1 Tax=Cytospora mali TaxID=578113 RepID=A0A194VRY2_CYTMA|nr:hypothetical protein VM1G_02198 [Valsa mali]
MTASIASTIIRSVLEDRGVEIRKFSRSIRTFPSPPILNHDISESQNPSSSSTAQADLYFICAIPMTIRTVAATPAKVVPEEGTIGTSCPFRGNSAASVDDDDDDDDDGKG